MVTNDTVERGRRRRRRRSSAQCSPLVKYDPVEREREVTRHYLLEKGIVDLCLENGIKPLSNRHIDVLAQVGSTSIVFEMKTCPTEDISGPVRSAAIQLLEYRNVYRDKLGSDVRLCIVADRRPTGSYGGLTDYLEDLRIGIIWSNDGDDELGCGEFTRKLLGDVFPQLKSWEKKPVA